MCKMSGSGEGSIPAVTAAISVVVLSIRVSTMMLSSLSQGKCVEASVYGQRVKSAVYDI